MLFARNDLSLYYHSCTNELKHRVTSLYSKWYTNKNKIREVLEIYTAIKRLKGGGHNSGGEFWASMSKLLGLIPVAHKLDMRYACDLKAEAGGPSGIQWV